MASKSNADRQQKPISNLLFDFVTILHSKAEGIAAYDKYLKDAEQESSQECVELLKRMRERDVEFVQEVKQHVAMLLERDGVSSSLGQSKKGGQSEQPSMTM